ncbi:MAG: helix-turn-helix transcriptional regulator [Clostridia bacterium]|nr:helix-turn-helix transcriptional regulator [Clostridia bacterium]
MDKRQFNRHLGSEIAKLRYEFGYSQEQMAEKSDLSRNYIGQIERGEKSLTVYRLYCILRALNISLEEFFSKF